MAPSNVAFDEDLRREDPRWGVREVEALTALAETHGLAAPRIFQMPANNHLLVFAAEQRELRHRSTGPVGPEGLPQPPLVVADHRACNVENRRG